jgi:ubiquinone/menaquinone biosynthesis C-methylase UbiE
MLKTAWQDAEVAHLFLKERRGAVPYGPEQAEMMLQLIRHFRPRPRLVMDLGCGDGFLARAILTAYPEACALLLDHSEPMLERAREAMAPFGDRCEILRADMGDSIAQYAEPGSADLVVSGYAIHHLPHARKHSLYGDIYGLLAPGGMFVNVEHVASPSRPLEQLFENLYMDHVAAHQGKPRSEVREFYLNRPDKADNILEGLEIQLTWLRELGFQHVDCYFKWLELAVFGGVKPGE